MEKACYANHIKNNKCVDYSYKCQKCSKFFLTKDLKRELHECDKFKCSNCKLWQPYDHECFMLKKVKKVISEKYIFFDFETKLQHKTNKHIVNYCVAQSFKGLENVFNNADEFCKWAFDKKLHKSFTFIAHYGKGYDFQFIAEWLVAHGVKPNIISNGQKILCLEVKSDYNIRFIDMYIIYDDTPERFS